MESFVALSLLALAVWYGLAALRTREQASRAARDACARMDLQFLDDTVACTGVVVVRQHGRLVLRRQYEFEYTADDALRHQGRVVLTGAELSNISLENTHVLQ